MNEIDDLILIEFFRDILQKKEELNLKEINDNESINFMIQIFKRLMKIMEIFYMMEEKFV